MKKRQSDRETLREPDGPTETECSDRKRKKRKERRRLTSGRDRWETRAAATMIETRCRPVQYTEDGEREEERWSTKELGEGGG